MRFNVRVCLACLLAVLFALGGVAGEARAAISLPGNQTECEAMGGWWFHAGYVNAYACFLPTSLYPDVCPGYTHLVFSQDIRVNCWDGSSYSNGAEVGSTGADCILDGGLWVGNLDGTDGLCVYPQGTAKALTACGPNYDLIFTIENSLLQGAGQCGLPGNYSGGGSYPPYGRFGAAVEGEPGAGSMSLGAPRNGSVSFAAGACAGKCTINPNLPGGAKANLPADAIATLYFRSTDADGQPGMGSYSVCFAVGELTSPVIYRYVSGAWVAQAVTISGGQVCASGSGDGAYALGGS